MKTINLTIAIAIALTCAAHAQAASANDQTFVTKAAQGGMMEVELGRMAASHGSSEAIKSFGQKMVTDHSKANDALKVAATQNELVVPPNASSMQQATIEKFKAKQGHTFDNAYAKAMVKDHKEDIALFEKEANSGTSPAIRTFARETLPTLKEHLKLAETMNKPTKSDSNASGRQ